MIGIFYSQIVESSSLVSILFREAISHTYIPFFHLLVNGFSVTGFRTSLKMPYLYWASEASPTLGCPIEISRDIYNYIEPVVKLLARYTVINIFNNYRLAYVALGGTMQGQI